MTKAMLGSVEMQLPAAGARKRMVIVADSSLVVEAIRIAFRASGDFNLVGYANGRRTTARTILDAQPDAVILDDMDRSDRSLELLRATRSEDQNVAILVLTAQLDADWLNQVFDAGATAVISKATRPAALVTLVRETLNGRIVHRPHAAVTAAPRTLSADELSLTRRELEILQLVASGATNGDIARRLWVTQQTVKFHLRNIYRKLEVTNRTQASNFAHVNGLVEVAEPPARRLALAAS